MNEFIKQSGFLPAIKLEKLLPKRVATLAMVLFFACGIGLLILGLNLENDKAIAFAKFFAGLGLLTMVLVLFANHLQHDKGIDFLSVRAIHAATKNNDFYPLKFLNHLISQPRFKWALYRLGIEVKDFETQFQHAYTNNQALSFDAILSKALQVRKSEGEVLNLSNFIFALSESDRTFNKIMFDYGIKSEDLIRVFSWERNKWLKSSKAYKFWDPEKVVRVKGIGKNWSAGYTPNLDKIGFDLTERIAVSKPENIYGHRRYINQIERFLVDGTHNALLVGSPGVGKHAIINNLALHMNEGNVLQPLQYQRLVQINTSSILSGNVEAQSSLDKIQLLFSEALWSGNIILVINDVDALFDPKNEVGRINATEALIPFLKSRLRIIGLTTQTGFQSTINKNPELLRWFAKIEVVEPEFDETLRILEDHVEKIEYQSGLVFSYQSLKEIVELSTKLIQNLPNPEKSLEILESTAIFVNTQSSNKLVLAEHVQQVITERTQIPVNQVRGQEKDLLMNMESILHQWIVGQDEAVKQIANALRRARSGIKSEKRPIGSFLFLGPTGVGKTETTKALASVYFGSEKKIIRMDMSEFQEVHALNRIIGDADRNEGGMLTEAVMDNPFSIILLDEIEKAHPKILDLFLQVLDEGRLTDALSRTVDFTNCMIIATSNAGSELIRESVKDSKVIAREKVIDYVQKNGIFKPEFLNRFDGVIIFKPLLPDELLIVSELLIKDLNRRLKEKDVSVKSTPELIKVIVDKGYSPEFGARSLRRFVSENVENYIASGLISGEIKRGDVIELDGYKLANT